MNTQPCSVCPRPVQLSERHVVVTWNVEQEARGVITVHESEEISWMHLDCARQVGAGQAAPDHAGEVAGR